MNVWNRATVDGGLIERTATYINDMSVAELLRREGGFGVSSLRVELPIDVVKIKDIAAVKVTLLGMKLEGLETLTRHELLMPTDNHSLAFALNATDISVTIDIELELSPMPTGPLAGTPPLRESLQLLLAASDVRLDALLFLAVNNSAIALVKDTIPSAGCIMPLLLNASVRQLVIGGHFRTVGVAPLGGIDGSSLEGQIDSAIDGNLKV